MLDLVADDPTAALFRTYGWTEPTLSLGYFQSVAQAEADPRWRDVPLVRRPTGGGALWHHHEVTYAVVVPRGHPLARRTVDLYRAVHAAIARLVTIEAPAVRMRGDADAPGTDRPRPFLCFDDKDPEDLVIGASKVAGSAQRRRAGAVLQHGSLLVAASAVTPHLPGLDDLAAGPGVRPDWADWKRPSTATPRGRAGADRGRATTPRLGEFRRTGRRHGIRRSGIHRARTPKPLVFGLRGR
jgi:lipoate-protein ligase A